MEEEAKKIELKRGNIGLPFGLCKKFGIELPDNATPRDAWDKLAGKGLTPDNVYAQLKKQATIDLPDNKTEVKNIQVDVPEDMDISPSKLVENYFKEQKNNPNSIVVENIGGGVYAINGQKAKEIAEDIGSSVSSKQVSSSQANDVLGKQDYYLNNQGVPFMYKVMFEDKNKADILNKLKEKGYNIHEYDAIDNNKKPIIDLPEKKIEVAKVDYKPYTYGRITKMEAGVIYKAMKSDKVKVLPETIKMLYDYANEKGQYAGYFDKQYSNDSAFYDKIYSATSNLLNDNIEQAQKDISDLEQSEIKRATKKNIYYGKYAK